LHPAWFLLNQFPAGPADSDGSTTVDTGQLVGTELSVISGTGPTGLRDLDSVDAGPADPGLADPGSADPGLGPVDTGPAADSADPGPTYPGTDDLGPADPGPAGPGPAAVHQIAFRENSSMR
jgi:hypothetical protein